MSETEILMMCFEAEWMNCYRHLVRFVEGQDTSSSLPDHERSAWLGGLDMVTSKGLFQPQPSYGSVTCQKG